MNPAALLILAIIEKSLQYGAPVAIQMLNEWKVKDPTIADIEKWRITRPAASYFSPVAPEDTNP